MEDVPGTLQVRALGAWVQRSPDPKRTVVFGRSRDDVHLVVGGDDLRVSRRQGVLSYRDGRWWISNVGRPPIRMADRLLFTDEEPVPLPTCFTPLVVQGSPGREHLVEVHVSDGACGRPARAGPAHARPDALAAVPGGAGRADRPRPALPLPGPPPATADVAGHRRAARRAAAGPAVAPAPGRVRVGLRGAGDAGSASGGARRTLPTTTSAPADRTSSRGGGPGRGGNPLPWPAARST